jgi:hypothetical protein
VLSFLLERAGDVVTRDELRLREALRRSRDVALHRDAAARRYLTHAPVLMFMFVGLALVGSLDRNVDRISVTSGCSIYPFVSRWERRRHATTTAARENEGDQDFRVRMIVSPDRGFDPVGVGSTAAATQVTNFSNVSLLLCPSISGVFHLRSRKTLCMEGGRIQSPGRSQCTRPLSVRSV